MLRDPLGREVLVLLRAHLLGAREVEPELVAPEHPFLLLGHLAVHEAASRGHPLDAAAGDQAVAAAAVAVPHPALEHDRDRLEAAVRMIGEAPDVGVRLVGVQLVEEEEGVEVIERALPDHARERDARPVLRGQAWENGQHLAARDGAPGGCGARGVRARAESWLRRAAHEGGRAQACEEVTARERHRSIMEHDGPRRKSRTRNARERGWPFSRRRSARLPTIRP